MRWPVPRRATGDHGASSARVHGVLCCCNGDFAGCSSFFPIVLIDGAVIFGGVELTLEIPEENPYNRNIICEF